MHWLDWLALAACLGGLLALGRRAARGMSSGRDYFLGRRPVPWVPAGLALAASELSVLTLIGVPAAAFREDWSTLQFFVGSAAARLLIAAELLPPVLTGGGATAYALVGRRCGPGARAASAALFLLIRFLSSAARLSIAAAAAAALLGWRTDLTLLLMAALAAAALVEGGAESAAWTGALQYAVVAGAVALAAIFLVRRVDGGLVAAAALAASAGKLQLLGGGWWAALGGLLTGFFGAAAMFGTDHEMLQKPMSVQDPAKGRLALLLSIAASLGALLLLLALGSLLFVFYKQNPGLALPPRPDELFNHVAATVLRPVLQGLAAAALVLVSIDLPLASMSAAALSDLDPSAGEPSLRHSRWTAGALAAALAAAAWLFARAGGSPWLAFKVGGIGYGPLLGAFAFALYSGERVARGGAVALLVPAAGCALALAGLESARAEVNWSWLVPIGAAATWGLLLLSAASPRPASRAQE